MMENHAGYGTNLPPIIVTPIKGSKTGQIIARIGKFLCFFDETDNYPELGVPIEVMIKNPLFSKDENRRLIGFRVKVVDLHRHDIIAISGFERTGFNKTTMATGFSVSASERRHYSKKEVDTWPDHSLGNDVYIPGKVRIRVVDNRNADLLNNDTRVPLTPTNIWVNKRKYEDQQGPRRVLGLAHLEDADYLDQLKR